MEFFPRSNDKRNGVVWTNGVIMRRGLDYLVKAGESPKCNHLAQIFAEQTSDLGLLKFVVETQKANCLSKLVF